MNISSRFGLLAALLLASVHPTTAGEVRTKPFVLFDDLATLLSVWTWSFTVDAPDSAPSAVFVAVVELKRNGSGGYERSVLFSGIEIPLGDPAAAVPISVALAPASDKRWTWVGAGSASGKDPLPSGFRSERYKKIAKPYFWKGKGVVLAASPPVGDSAGGALAPDQALVAEISFSAKTK